jgi:hypothetical protein
MPRTKQPPRPQTAPQPWVPLDFGTYMREREGKIWQPKDTETLLNRLEQVDDWIVRLMRAAGFKVVD